MRRTLAAASVLALTSAGFVAGPASGAGTKVASCPKTTFDGTISRTEDDFSDQPAAERDGAEMTSGIVYDFGTGQSLTVYVGDYAIDPDELGSTLVAPEGNVLVTIFLASKKPKPLHEGQKLKVGRDFVTVIVDAGGVAQASSEDQQGSAKITKLSERRICFTIDYQDAHQNVDGRVSAPIP